MLSYRHGFHAGNHADVLKHLVLLGLLEKLRGKDKPFTCIDSHAGAGLYDLFNAHAQTNREHESGIVPLCSSQPVDPLLRHYVERVRACNPDSRLRFYPGSPLLIQGELRAQDRLHVLELHPAEQISLQESLGQDRRVSLHLRDAFEGLLALTPPEPRRGMALIDPSYEDKKDYQRVHATLVKLQRRWPVGILALWYPLLARERDHSHWLCAALARENLPDVLQLELSVGPQAEEFGMHGSGMLVINTPWQLREQMQASLGELVKHLGGESSCSIQSLSSAN
jgi:23S rRNA (adenine2030-N6)-methyltransferase